MCLCGGIIIEI